MSEKSSLKEKQPVVAVMGHVDHGKSSLLDAIRNTNIVDGEVGGITQHVSAYEVSHQMQDTKEVKKITFLDTPGHAAFGAMRESGAKIADIAILIVSAEDGAMPQTLEAYKTISDNKVPCVVAISKVDKPNANIQKTKNSLVESGIYIEGMGGDIPFVEIDSKTKKGIPDLLETILLVAEMADLKYDENKNAEGFVLETLLDGKRGISSTLIIKDGILPKSGSILAGTALSPIRIIEDFAGKPIQNPKAGQVIKVTGFDSAPEVNADFISSDNKKEIEKLQTELKNEIKQQVLDPRIFRNAKLVIPVVLKADTMGTYSVVEKELKKIEVDEKSGAPNGIKIKFVGGGIGNITESDVLASAHDENVLIVGFNVKVENKAKDEAERLNIKPVTFDIIYKLGEWFRETVDERLPHEEIEKLIGKLKILKTFSTQKDKQVLGGKVLEGSMKLGAKVKIFRRDFEIGSGKVLELQSMKIKAVEVTEGNECGIMIESKTEIIPGDMVQIIEIERRKII
ncbi:Translation initiation factor IF-2 [bioreactor metagenome]|uniref:Translation initiation factor IF-2 n=1 Tax=bioreactor metagenome TaxID=1076179 RepID=A0A644T8X9_9ZZZZ|nr:GTP-binding protein [Candidatus Elulimicrobiales bacterium]